MPSPSPSTRCDHDVNRLVKLYERIHDSAMGDRRKHSGFSFHDATKNTAFAITTAVVAWPTLIFPAGNSRALVRGLRASISRSTIRLNAIAENRAAVNATTTQATIG